MMIICCVVSFIVGLATAAIAKVLFSLKESPAEEVEGPAIGSHWRLRGHAGDVVSIISGDSKPLVYFMQDDGSRQIVPLDYFMAVAKSVKETE